MGTLEIPCPLCCNESFPSKTALKTHLLDVIDQLHCICCKKKFDDLNALAMHVTDCTGSIVKIEQFHSNENTDGNSANEEEDESLLGDPEIVIIKRDADEDEEEQADVINKPQDESESNGAYLCQMCNVNFDNVDEHLEKFHQGEEIVVDTGSNDDDNSNRDPEVIQTVEADNEMIFEEEDLDVDVDHISRAKTLEVRECVDKEGRMYTRRVVKIDKFWMKPSCSIQVDDESEQVEPLLEKYLFENGKIKKISYEEAANAKNPADVIEIYQCPRCCMQFPNHDYFTKHKCDPSEVKDKYKCAYCTALFLNIQSVQIHMQSHKKIKREKKTVTLGPFQCETCETKFPSYKSLRLHSRMHEPIQAKLIDEPVSYSIVGMKSEEEPVTKREMFNCSVCDKTMNKEYEEVHLRSHTEDNNFICAICNRKFADQENLDMHMKAHGTVKKFVCNYCKKPFLMAETLKEHVKNQCQKRQYECQYCGRRFSRPHEKVKHERIHTGEKPHICEVCGKAFRVSYCLTLHMRTHSGTRPYQCTHCAKRFKSHSVFNHHLLTHSDVRAYKCPFCPKAFKTSVQLAGHKNSHTKPFACTECNRPFASLYAVRIHMETHKRENNLKFDCWLCGASYARAFALRDHMKAAHDGLGAIENENEVEEMGEVEEMEVVEATDAIVEEVELVAEAE